MSIRYDKVGRTDYDSGYDPERRCVDSAVTVEVSRGDMFGEAVANLVQRENGKAWMPTNAQILMTTEAHWSGYSEFTITNQWSQIVLTVPAWNWEREWPSLGDFLRALADANPEADR